MSLHATYYVTPDVTVQPQLHRYPEGKPLASVRTGDGMLFSSGDPMALLRLAKSLEKAAELLHDEYLETSDPTDVAL